MPGGLDLLKKNPDGTFSPKTDRGLFHLYLSKSGGGKSAAIASLLEIGKMYVFDFDHRIESMISCHEWLGGVDILKNLEFDQYSPIDGYQAFDNKMEQMLALAKNRQLPYKTVVIESIGSINRAMPIMSNILRGQANPGKGKVRGGLSFNTPDDYNFLSRAWSSIIYEFCMPLTKMGINVIVSGWIVPIWGKPKDYDPDKNMIVPDEIIGEGILGPVKIAEELIGYFNEVYRFMKEDSNSETIKSKYKVMFTGKGLARSVYKMPQGWQDITNKPFYPYWKSIVEKQGVVDGKSDK